MKLKKLVMLSSFLVLTVLFVCVSVYAYNAYCTASKAACRATASANGYGLFNGNYTVYARVDSTTDQDGGSFAIGNNLSDSAIVDLDSCSDGSAYASVSGYDANNNFYSMEDNDAFHP